MTHTELGITHILEISPRGFANEVSVLPVTRAFLPLAEDALSRANDDVNAWGSLLPWDEAPAALRQTAGMVLRDLSSPEDLDALLVEEFMPDIHLIPNAYELRDGQWRFLPEGAR